MCPDHHNHHNHYHLQEIRIKMRSVTHPQWPDITFNLDIAAYDDDDDDDADEDGGGWSIHVLIMISSRWKKMKFRMGFLLLMLNGHHVNEWKDQPKTVIEMNGFSIYTIPFHFTYSPAILIIGQQFSFLFCL